MVDFCWIVVDFGCGGGVLSGLFVFFVEKVVVVDVFLQMFEGVWRWFVFFEYVEVCQGDFELLLIEDVSCDFVIFFFVLYYVVQLFCVFVEVRCVLCFGGCFFFVDMLSYDCEEYCQEMGYVWFGFVEDDMECFFVEVGFVVLCVQLFLFQV